MEHDIHKPMDLTHLVRSSVIAVPPLALGADGHFDRQQNQRLISYLEDGGVSLLLYGGNAVLYHLRPSRYADLLAMVSELASPSTVVIPSAGPSFGMMMDQAEVLRDFAFPTAMILPQRDVADAEGIMRGVRLFAERLGRPVVLYIKFSEWLSAAQIGRLYDDGLVSWVKYAMVRESPQEDPLLKELTGRLPAQRIVSGMGEQPAVIHLRDFGLAGFTSGCVCIAPRLSMQMLRELQQGRHDAAERIRAQFATLEHLRDAIHPIRVLHRAVDLADIAQTGPMTPLLSELDEVQEQKVRRAAKELIARERQAQTDAAVGP
jgi:dihydrodipicolinate synthase/N-acetylneuraminate lyase